MEYNRMSVSISLDRAAARYDRVRRVIPPFEWSLFEPDVDAILDLKRQRNAIAVVESLRAERVIMLPDEYLARNVAAQTKVEIIAWKGHCEVHERFTPDDIAQAREAHPGVIVLAHPECPPEVVAVSDFAG